MNQVKPKVSVIVPVWGVEKYIEKCARSLFEQTLDDIEYVFVDDCTPDNSIAIIKEVLKEYPKRIPQTKIVQYEKNRGLPQARKAGFEVSTGDFIIYCDSDDWVERDTYAQMYKFCVSNDFDLVQCDIDVVSDKGVEKTLTSKVSKPTSERLKHLIIDGEISNSLCNKLVKRTVYADNLIEFPQYSMNEDNAVAIQLAYFSRTLGYIKQAYYKAYFNMSSISRKSGEEQQYRKFFESFENSKMMVEFLFKNGYDSKSKAVLRAKMRPKIVLFNLLNKVKYLREWRGTYPEINCMAVIDKRLPMGVRIRSFFALTCLYPLFYKIINK